MQETRVWSLGWEDPLEKEMSTHSSILVWRIPRTEEPGRLPFMGSQRVRHDWATNSFIIAKQPWTFVRCFFFLHHFRCFFFHFINEMYMLSCLCILGINPALSWCVVLLVCCWILFANICCNFLSCNVLVWLWQQSNTGLIEWIWKCSLFLNFFLRVYKELVFFKCLVDSPVRLCGLGFLFSC